MFLLEDKLQSHTTSMLLLSKLGKIMSTKIMYYKLHIRLILENILIDMKDIELQYK